MNRAFRIAASALALAGLAACETPTSSPRPTERAAPIKIEAPAPAPSERSKALRDYYARVQQGLLIQGLMRTDGGGPDTPFSKRQLVENFIQTGVYNEFTLINGRYVEGRAEGRVQRWTRPVKVGLSFGPRIDDTQQAEDRKRVTAYVRKLARVTSAPISMSQANSNFHVAVLDVDALDNYGPTLQSQVPGLTREIAAQITQMPRDIYCAVYAFSDPASPDEFVKAVAIIRSEHPDLLRASCFHEEIAQGLGLSNDSPAARPSIFNDDNEFALLTRHDELLLQMLYDKRLPLGANPAQARPVVNILAAELLGGES